MARGSMTMRAQVERNVETLEDEWGQPRKSVFVAVAVEVPCRAWSKTRREIDDTGKEAVVEDMRALFPASADILRNDRLTIVDRLGTGIFSGPVAVDTITQRRRAAGASHVELMLTRHV